MRPLRLASLFALLVACSSRPHGYPLQEPGIDPSFPAAKAVVELFTSQGCSSCPPPTAVLATFVKRDDVIALSLPVDYWDYLGWKDTLASPKFSERQRAYARPGATEPSTRRRSS